MTDATKATPLTADIQPKIGEYTSPGVQTPPPAIPQDQLTGKTHGRNPSRARAKSRVSVRTRGAIGSSWLRFAPNIVDEGVEGRREKKTKAGHAQHAKEHGGAQ